MFKFICKLTSKHKWQYRKKIIGYAEGRFFRVCRRCHAIQLYEDLPVYGRCWTQTVEFTKKAGKNFFSEEE